MTTIDFVLSYLGVVVMYGFLLDMNNLSMPWQFFQVTISNSFLLS